MIYEMEELIPVVAELSRKYTSGESTSISYERAGQLMAAVVYCIEELEETEEQENYEPEIKGREANNSGKDEQKINISKFDEQKIVSSKDQEMNNQEVIIPRENDKSSGCGSTLISSRQEKLSPQAAYESGYQLVVAKTRQTLERYQKLMLTFEDYGSRNLYDTAVRGLTGFFQYYDPKFAPQNTILTMDYPTLNLRYSLKQKGINAIAEYVEAIGIEQTFLHAIPREYVIQVLKQFDSNYEEQMFNISTIVVRHLVAKAIVSQLRRDMTRNSESAENNNEQIISDNEFFKYAQIKNQEELRTDFVNIFQGIVDKYVDENTAYDISKYFTENLGEFALELKNVSESRFVRNVVVLL